jgi:hypothetical protein
MGGYLSSASRHPQNNKNGRYISKAVAEKKEKKIGQTEYILERTMLSECLLKWSKTLT